MLTLKDKSRLWLQGAVSYMNLFWFIPIFVFILRFVGGYHAPELKAYRRETRKLLERYKGRPVLICANHLTMIDSLIMTWVLFQPLSFFWRFQRFPWNMPEKANFARNIWLRLMCYLGKCVFVERQGGVQAKKHALEQLKYLVASKQLVCVFPEGGRSRSGCVDVENAVYGVGDIVQSVPGCVVLCIYMRGRGQRGYSYFPQRGECFDFKLEVLEPEVVNPGRRGARAVCQQIMARLVAMEEGYFAEQKLV